MRFRRLLFLCALALPAVADEGMWLFNQFPKDQVKEKYGFEVTDQFLENLRLASMRIGGGSGSFVSPNGLVFTNHHVASDCISKVSSSQHDYVKDGFYAATRQQELQCPDLEANVLVGMEDVTSQVKDAAKDGVKAAEALEKRNAAIARIEKTCADKTGGTCTVVQALLGPALRSLPVQEVHRSAAGVRARIRASPFSAATPITSPTRATTSTSLSSAPTRTASPPPRRTTSKWSAEGVQDTALVFVAGNPAATSRLDDRRAARLLPGHFAAPDPDALADAHSSPARLLGPERREPAAGPANLVWLLEHLQIDGRQAHRLERCHADGAQTGFEKKLRNAVERDPKLGTAAGKVWDEVAAAYKTWTPFEKPYQVLERPAALGSNLFRIARQIVRLSEERGKPNDQRLPEYRDQRPALARTRLVLARAHRRFARDRAPGAVSRRRQGSG